MTIRIRILNDEAVARALEGIGAQLQRNTLKRAVRRAANVIRDEAVLQAPQHADLPDMRDAIKVTVTAKDGVPTAYVRMKGPHAYLGPFQEYGVAPHFLGKNTADPDRRMHPGHQPANGGKGFLRPAFDAKADEAAEAFAAYLRADLESRGYMKADDPPAEAGDE